VIDWLGVLIFLLSGAAFGVIGIGISYLIMPRTKNRYKLEVYESGIPVKASAWVRFRNQYFTYVLIFVIFDVEILYLFPWAVSFVELGLSGLIKMFIFIFILVLGLWYAWKEGAFEWR